MQRGFDNQSVIFLSTLPARGATHRITQLEAKCKISIHAPREGSDQGFYRGGMKGAEFLSTLPARGATGYLAAGHKLIQFLSTLPARGATLCRGSHLYQCLISIHAPREGSDPAFLSSRSLPGNFYPRSPRGERRYSCYAPFKNKTNFYPRSPRGERLVKLLFFHQAARISIHAPREGSDIVEQRMYTVIMNFYPRSPRGERRDEITILE